MHYSDDEAITGTVIAAFAASPIIHSNEIRVTTNQGKVHIQGVVERLEEKLAAEETAGRIQGVRGVQNDITVSADRDISDLEIQRKAQEALDDAGIEFIGVNIETGGATLMGVVDSTDVRDRAIDVVTRTPGVRSVYSQIEIAVGMPEDDIRIATNVIEALTEEPKIEFYDLEAESIDGHVTIHGGIKADWQSDLATRVAESVPGVKSVKNALTVKTALT